MNIDVVMTLLLDTFNRQNIRYALIGGFALQAAGLSRMTQDIDFLVHFEDATRAKSYLLGLGYDIVHESEDAINFWGKLKELGGVDFIIARRKYTLAMLKRSRDVVMMGKTRGKVVVIEDIIGLKLQALVNDPTRFNQDMADIQWLIQHEYKTLDVQLLYEYFNLMGKAEDLKKILERASDAQ